MRLPAFGLIGATLAALVVGPARSADLAKPAPPPVIAVPDIASLFAPPVVVDKPKPPHRALTTYMASYPFGVLREDYTPLGAPGVSKRDYYGLRTMTATLHVAVRERRVVRRKAATRRVLRVRY